MTDEERIRLTRLHAIWVTIESMIQLREVLEVAGKYVPKICLHCVGLKIQELESQGVSSAGDLRLQATVAYWAMTPEFEKAVETGLRQSLERN